MAAMRPVGRAWDLTEREVEVLCLIVRGWTDARIACELVCSVKTVNAHVRAILGKLGAENRTEAVGIYLTERLQDR